MPLDLSRLDPAQRAAVTAPDGPVLVFAGAGSGKTRTLTARAAWLIERGVDSREILAVTFTRKAADEMRRRLTRLLPDQGLAGLRVGTFHAQLAMALRREEPELLATVGRTRRFSIWDEDDRERSCRALLREAGLSELPGVSAKRVAEQISHWKNDGLTPEQLPAQRETNGRVAARLWPAYEASARQSDALDFDDLLTVPMRLLTDNAELRQRWSAGIRHLLVDEFQDTNAVQLRLVELLSTVHGNLFVVGDDAQSIYAFRGAQIENILRFRERYPRATVITLTTNYRSTQAICDVANLILARNKSNVAKVLQAGGPRPEGPKPTFRRFYNEYAEARWIAEQLTRLNRPADCAVLVRMNRQTRVIELALSEAGIPYRVLGGTAFWAREEVRDLVAWLRVLANPRDANAFRRALVKPGRRGIGDSLAESVARLATEGDGDWPVAIRAVAASREGTVKGRASLAHFGTQMEAWAAEAPQIAVAGLVRLVLDGSGLLEFYGDGSDEGEQRVENLREVISATASYGPGELSAFLESATLDSELGKGEVRGEAVSLATLHATKGLEWPVVFLAGCEEGLLPHANSSEPAEIEEERRLFYVGVTRTKHLLYLSAAALRSLSGDRSQREVSRFVREAAPALVISRPGTPSSGTR